MPDAQMLTYFAYGSNMCIARMRSRVPGAVDSGTARLEGHVLRWHKASKKDGSGKCDAYFTGHAEDEVLGLVYRIPADEKERLDKEEGLGKGYDEKVIVVVTRDGQRVEATTYVAASYAIHQDLPPYDWYKEYVLCGARGQSLPSTYIDALQQQASVPDRDAGRAARERRSHRELHVMDGR